jgi:hypothetical protein
MHSQQPLIEKNLGTLKHGADCHTKLLTAILALPETGSMSLAVQRIVFAHYSAMRTYDIVRPGQGFEVFAGFVSVLEMGFGKHGNLLQ